ncbi:hypothetical protein GUJ93_ZPchr0008g11983 [Zizania palustris]|uniref:Uncharacterized protein n=1 Tax=Zizania palustris TaxID=103762 RepID=A0A8J5RJ63_ZIZPA|nr:hypothetical protein GUJ93_ZPchr0008g11983 [Zizania palustris]
MKRHHTVSPKTVSTCIPNISQGTHIFDIRGYSDLKGMGHEEFIKSGDFPVGGFDWAIVLYPDVNTFLDLDEITAFLELRSEGGDKVRASCDVRLVDQITGNSSSAHPTTKNVKLFNVDEVRRVNCLMMKRSEFEAPPYLLDDRITMECVVTVMHEPRVSRARPIPRINVPPPNITEQLGKLLESKEGADVTFDVAGETFAAHKLVLAMRSPVFKVELCGLMMESGTQHIAVTDMQPAVFKALLQFIYTDWLPGTHCFEGEDNGEMIRHLLVAANKYDVDRLKLLCQSILCKNLHARNVATTLALADQHNCDILKDACIEFMSFPNMMNDVAATQGYKDLQRMAPSVLAEAMEKMSKIKKMKRN